MHRVGGACTGLAYYITNVSSARSQSRVFDLKSHQTGRSDRKNELLREFSKDQGVAYSIADDVRVVIGQEIVDSHSKVG